MVDLVQQRKRRIFCAAGTLSVEKSRISASSGQVSVSVGFERMQYELLVLHLLIRNFASLHPLYILYRQPSPPDLVVGYTSRHPSRHPVREGPTPRGQ